jgi:Ca2+-binding EF-hand superfamily protein
VNKLEIKKMLRDLGDEFTNKLCNRMLSYSKANDDGKMNFEEFLKALVYVAPPPEEKKPEGEEGEGEGGE